MKEHKLSLGSAILHNMNIMVGSGILIGSGASAAIAGNASFLGWIVVFTCFLPLVLGVIKLSSLFPTASGTYVYAKEGLGYRAGFITAWLYITGYTFTGVVECLALRGILSNATNHFWLFENQILFNALLVTVCAGLCLLSMRYVSAFLNSLTIVKLLPLVILIALIPFIYNPSFTITTAELQALPFSLPLLIFGFFGFEYCASMSHMIENSEKNAPRAILLGFLATVVLYTLFHFGVLNLMGAHNLAQTGASSFANYLHIPVITAFLKFLIPIASALTVFAVGLGVMSSNAMLMSSLGERNYLVGSKLLAQQTSLGRPWFTIALQAILVFVLATAISQATASINEALNIAGGLCIFGVFLSFVLPLISLVKVLKNRGMRNHLPLAYLGLTTLAGFVAYSWYSLGSSVIERCQYSLILVVVLAVGLMLMKKPSED